MRIGLFTDSYRPSINGIVYVVESLKRELEALGHEVYVFCPAKSISPSKQAELLHEDDNSRIIRFRSIKGAFFDDYDTSVFFPPVVQRQIANMNLDVVHIFTPSQIGLLGVKAANKNNIPLVVQHCTDLYEFVDHYPAVLPGALALAGIVFPLSVKLNGQDLLEVAKLYRPRNGVTKWNKDIIERVITILYSKADAVIALSRKSRDQLQSWQTEDYSYKITLMPNGVNALPKPKTERIKEFRKQWGLGVVYEVMKVFTFPSLKDTQGWVLHEAAHAGKPIVIIDTEVSEVVKDGINGYFAENTPESVAEKVISILKSPKKQAEFSAESKKLARKFTERSQVKKLEKLYQSLIETRKNLE